jgi:hypothetical protein
MYVVICTLDGTIPTTAEIGTEKPPVFYVPVLIDGRLALNKERFTVLWTG